MRLPGILIGLWFLLTAQAGPLHLTKPGRLSGSRPNIILIMSDDQGYGELSCHGNPILQTPHLDRLHSQSLRFTQYHVSPTCAPTRSALLTGRHEFRNGVTHTIFERERLRLDAVTLAEVLRGRATPPESSANGTWATRTPTCRSGAGSIRC